MSAMQTEVYEAFRAIDVPEDKALKAAAALATAFAGRDAETDASFVDRDRRIDRIQADIGAVKADLSTIRADLVSLHDSAATNRT